MAEDKRAIARADIEATGGWSELKPSRERPIRGDVNVILNGLLRESVIAGFETPFDKQAPAKRVG